jgi:hypothetical protein
VINSQEYAARIIYNCPLCGTFVISDLAIESIKASATHIASFMMRRKNSDDSDVVLITNNYSKSDRDYLQVSVSEILAQYPQSFGHKIEAALRNLADKSEYPGALINIDRLELCPWLYVERRKEEALAFMLFAMQDEKLISIQSQQGMFLPCTVSITAKGWSHIEETRATKQKSAYKALVLSSDDEYCKAVKRACRATNYQMSAAAATDISPALIAQIKSAELVICEISDYSPVAYYAAGMAKAMGKHEILTCNAKKRGEVPFPGEQMGILKWKTPEDLSNNLTYTIQSFFI